MSKQFNYCLPSESYPGSTFYNAVWGRIEGIWREKLSHYGMLADVEPSSVLVDVVSVEGQPMPAALTTHDETIHGDGRLADGVSLGSEESSRRAKANYRHLRLYMKHRTAVRTAKLNGQPVPDTPAFLEAIWNWTKGRPAGDGDESVDVIGVVGTKMPMRPVDPAKARAHIAWPNEKWAEALKTTKKTRKKVV